MLFQKETGVLFNLTGAIWGIQLGKTPGDCISEFYNPSRDRSPNIAPGMVIGICELLSGRVEIKTKNGSFLIKKDEHTCHSHFEPSEACAYWVQEGHTTFAAMTLMQSLLHPDMPNVGKYFQELVQHLPKKDGYYTLEQLEQAQTPEAKQAMLRLQDALYFGLKTATQGGMIKVAQEMPSEAELATYEPYDLSRWWKNQVSDHHKLLLLGIERGKTALLIGPTGTFKTEMAKRAATETGAAMVVIKGRPGMEDRDFFQSIVPTPEGPKVIDGPVTEAFRKAQKQRTLLLLDELLRFEPYYLGALVGALDQYSPAELKAMGLSVPEDPASAAPKEAMASEGQEALASEGQGIEGQSQGIEGQSQGWGGQSGKRYYCLSLPSGEKVVTPTENLSIVATTNLGDDYNQGQQIDAALFGRFNLRINITHPSDDMLLGIYQRSSKRYAGLALEIDKYTRGHQFELGGLLKREASAARPEEELDHAVRQIVARSVAPEGVVDIFAAAGLSKPDLSILSDDFLAEVRGLPQRNLAVEVLRRLLYGEIKSLRRKNVVQARSFAELFEPALRRYQNRAIEAAQVLEELIALAKELRQADSRGESLGLSAEELAFYDALETNDSAVKVMGDETLRTIARELLQAVRTNVTIDWTRRENVRAQMRVLVKRILRKYGYPPDKQNEAMLTVLEQAELLSEAWAA